MACREYGTIFYLSRIFSQPLEKMEKQGSRRIRINIQGTTIHTILVTGGTGFLGQYLIDRLRQNPENRIAVLSRNPERIITSRGGAVRKVTGDLTKPETLAGSCSGIDTVFHLAGEAHVEADDPYAHKLMTVAGTRNLLDIAGLARVKKFIFFSSVKAMGEETTQLADESCAGEPRSAYGKSRLKAEELVLAAGKRYGMHTCNLRLAMVYGAGCKGNIPRMVAAIDRNRFPPLPEVGNKRSMVHALDVVGAALLAMDSPVAAGKTYIVTDGVAYSARDLYVALCRGLGKRAPSWAVPASILRMAARFGDKVKGKIRFPLDSDTLSKLLGCAWYSSAKIARELGYEPTRTFHDAVPEIIADYRSRCA